MRRIVLICFTLLYGLASVPMVNAAQAQTLSDQQIEIIRANCESAQVTLQQLQQSDLATRLSRGRGYEQLLRLMTVFNSRVVLNKYDASNLTAATADFESQFRKFQRDYITYSEQLSATIEMQCEDQPVTFYDELNLVRQYRAELGQGVASIEQLLDLYQQRVNELQAEVAAEEEEMAS